MKRCAFVLFVLFLSTCPAYSKTVRRRPQPETWYDQALRRINPENIDYGAIFEERKRAFFGQLGNPYFQYSLGATAAVIFFLTVTCVQRISHNRAMEIAAESIADVLRHDQYSREVARKAIKRYNDHIEACNRVIEAEQTGKPTAPRNSVTNAEIEAAREEVNRLKEELEIKSATIAEMSVRYGAEPIELTDLPSVPANLIERINQLELEIVAERKKNLRVKGTALDARNS